MILFLNAKFFYAIFNLKWYTLIDSYILILYKTRVREGKCIVYIWASMRGEKNY